MGTIDRTGTLVLETCKSLDIEKKQLQKYTGNHIRTKAIENKCGSYYMLTKIWVGRCEEHLIL